MQKVKKVNVKIYTKQQKCFRMNTIDGINTF